MRLYSVDLTETGEMTLTLSPPELVTGGYGLLNAPTFKLGLKSAPLHGLGLCGNADDWLERDRYYTYGRSERRARNKCFRAFKWSNRRWVAWWSWRFSVQGGQLRTLHSGMGDWKPAACYFQKPYNSSFVSSKISNKFSFQIFAGSMIQEIYENLIFLPNTSTLSLQPSTGWNKCRNRMNHNRISEATEWANERSRSFTHAHTLAFATTLLSLVLFLSP